MIAGAGSLAAVMAAAAITARLNAQDLARCRAAERFLVEQAGMTAVSSPDTLADWRTRKTVAGCRVTAAALTSRTLAAEAATFYHRLRSAGWTRTPDPRDAPNESSLRFRLGETDCLFSFYSGTTLATREEIQVNNAMVPRPGEARYNLLVVCVPAMDAVP
jgi:hypothetical protein